MPFILCVCCPLLFSLWSLVNLLSSFRFGDSMGWTFRSSLKVSGWLNQYCPVWSSGGNSSPLAVVFRLLSYWKSRCWTRTSLAAGLLDLPFKIFVFPTFNRSHSTLTRLLVWGVPHVSVWEQFPSGDCPRLHYSKRRYRSVANKFSFCLIRLNDMLKIVKVCPQHGLVLFERVFSAEVVFCLFGSLAVHCCAELQRLSAGQFISVLSRVFRDVSHLFLFRTFKMFLFLAPPGSSCLCCSLWITWWYFSLPVLDI